ncbi:hypothetical protein [Actinokineospora sp. NPDC004072]
MAVAGVSVIAAGIFIGTWVDQAPSTPTCDDIGVGATAEWIVPFREAYARAGGREAVGCPTPDSHGFVHRWEPGFSQDLVGGRAGQARIMALDTRRAVVMAGDYYRDYTIFHGESAKYQGYPTGDPFPCGTAQIVLLDGSSHSPSAMVTSPDNRFVWLRRPAWDLYRRHGGPQGPLGRPISGLGTELDGHITFEHGTITLEGSTADLAPETPLTPMTCMPG